MATPLTPIREERVPQCGLCQGPLKDPRVLSCLDVFCASCLEKHFREPTSGKGVCPKCLEKITLPEEGSSALRPAPHIQCLADVISAQGDGQCRMCSGARTAERYCVDCRLPLCSACEKIHSMVKGAKGHAVVAMGEGVGEGAATEVSSVLKNRQAECPHHPSQVCRKFCCTCQTLVCGECCEGKHASHQVEPLGLVAGRRRQSLHDLQASVLEYKAGLKTFQHEAHKYLTGMHEEFARVERHVQEHAQRLRQLVEERQTAALEILRKRKQEEEELVHSHLDSLQLTSKKVEQAGQFMDGVMAYACDAEIPEFAAFLRSRYREIRDNEKFLLHRKIKVRLHGPGLELAAMEALLRVEVEVRSPEPASATVVSTFRTDGSITGLAATQDDTLVVTSYCSKRFLVLSRHGKLIKEVKSGLTQPISVCVFQPDRIFITDFGDGQKGMGIREFSSSGQAVGTVSLPDRPWGIALTASGDRVVCHPERRQVVIYNPEGDLKRLIKSEGGKYLFSNPRCVTININHDIVVSDFAKHNIRVFDEEGKLKATFGSEGSGPEQLQHPCGVVCDRAGNILVADSDNRRVQLLSPKARFLTSLLTSQHGLEDPVALAVDRKGYLWVGEWSGKVHVVRYQ